MANISNDNLLNPHLAKTYRAIPEPGAIVTISETLDERGKCYGSFDGHAEVTQSIKRAMVDSENWHSLPDDMKESLEMIAHKIGRILNGDPEYIDSWHDISGYAKLVEDRLNAASV